MIRKQIKILGIGLVAAIALSALVAPSASAQEEQGVLTTETGEPVTLVGSELTGLTVFTTAFGAQTSCPGSVGTGHKVGATPHEMVPDQSTTVTMTLHPQNCSASTPFGNKPSTILTNGCDEVLHIGEAGAEETYSGSTELVCPEGKVYESIVYNDESHTEVLCILKVAPQTVAGSVEVTNTIEGDLEVTGTATGVHVTRSGLCTLDGKGTTTNNAEVHGGGTVEGLNELAEPTGIAISATE